MGLRQGGGEGRPLVTFFLITYNQEAFVRDALAGAFSQTYSPLEIVVSDDCSLDGTYAIIEEMVQGYDGKHRVVVNRNSENLGLIGHINRIVPLSSGELIVYAAGDDVSLPHRTERLVERYLASGRKASLIHSPVRLIDSAGRESGVMVPPVVRDGMGLEEMSVCTAMVIGATSAFSRSLQEQFGPIREERSVEDLVMGFRSVLTGGLEYMPEPLVLYRYDSGITAVPEKRFQTFAMKVQREVRELEMHLAVYRQRLLDLETIGRQELAPLLRGVRSRELLERKVLLGESSCRILWYALRRRMAGVFLSAWGRRCKWRLFFPFKLFFDTFLWRKA